MKLLEQVRQAARVKHFSYRTEKASAPSEKNSFVHCEQNKRFAHLKNGAKVRAELFTTVFAPRRIVA